MPGTNVLMFAARPASAGLLVCIEEVVSGDTGLIADGAEGGAFEGLVVWHGEGGAGAVWVLARHGDVVSFANDLESERLKRLDDALSRRVNRKLWHQMATPDSATKASRTGGSAWRTSSPKVSI